MTVVLIVRDGAWENVHNGRNRGSVPGRVNHEKAESGAKGQRKVPENFTL